MSRRRTVSILFVVMINLTFILPVRSQDSHGGAIYSKENYQFGRFEVVMQSAEGDGIVSSFFLYNLEAGQKCTWPEENNEIDIEMTGNDQNIYFTTHHPDPDLPWFYGEEFDLGFNPHRSLHKYAIEWEPGTVRWFVDGDLVYTQNEDATKNLKYPMAIMMNLWAAEFEDWAGTWDPSVLPRNSVYDYVSYAAYTPGSGDIGTNNNFTLTWKDDFRTLDTSRWEISDFDQISPLTLFRASNVNIDRGRLILNLTEPMAVNENIPVTFSVDVSDASLSPTDIVYLNGSFNDWCGTCNPMNKNGDTWSLTLDLEPNKYQYLFTVNGWQRTAGAPLDSDCDFQPCDDFPNYGLYLPEGSGSKILPTYCWETCDDCMITSTVDQKNSKHRSLIGTYDLMGRQVEPTTGRLLLYHYSDGSMERRVILR